ncbi:hypothetical protein B0T26DRAFT_688192 [Lasiosphaeria miniovina]|uniref:Secreted protein n=1 Tax=Lasiosphaeria miniovina TaxID=1954250 RepID=A0AA40BHI2_9PEZI|nr:uncharacterized protein B0T26DRAFT_688192 [Lasiosphaeria miniovina]KAK0734349.1 hypothetical protein B0T26DRAFT_688192 [Lasiosphaeria miniovina]
MMIPLFVFFFLLSTSSFMGSDFPPHTNTHWMEQGDGTGHFVRVCGGFLSGGLSFHLMVSKAARPTLGSRSIPTHLP